MAAPSTRASDADTRHRRERSKGRAESSPRTSSRIRLGLHSRKHDAEVEFYALRHAGERRRGHPQAAAVDAQDQPVPAPGRRVDGICLMGMEGMVSKHRESTNRGRPVPALDQGQELAASRVQQGSGSVLRGHCACDALR